MIGDKMANRQYEPFTLFNVRIVDMRNLWTPTDMFNGQKQQKASYFAGFITQKTQPQWHLEPTLAGLTQALGRIYQNNPQITDWRIADGDVPNAKGKSSEFAKGHWLFNASSDRPIKVELAQAGGALVPLQNKVGVKSGDYCMIGGSVAVSLQNSRAAKIYLNAVVFSSPGEEIVFANSVSGAELMRMAEQQGLRPAGFSPSPGGFTPQQPFGQQPQGFTPPGSSFAPTPGAPAAPAFAAPAPTGPGFGGNATYPSNPFAPR
jgi:hypothetical protein